MVGLSTQFVLNCLNGTNEKENGTFEVDGSHYNIKIVKEILKTLKGKNFYFTFDRQGEIVLKHDKGEITFFHIAPDTKETRKAKLDRIKWAKEQKEKDRLYKIEQKKIKAEEKLGDLKNSLHEVSKLINDHFSGKTKLTERKVNALIKKQKTIQSKIEKQEETYEKIIKKDQCSQTKSHEEKKQSE